MSNDKLITHYVRTLVNTAHEAGWDADEVCRDMDIDLEQALAGEGSYTASHLGLIVQHLSRWDDFLGQFPGLEKTGTFELMCELTMQSENLGTALDRGCRFYDMLLPQLSVELRVEGELAIIDIAFHMPERNNGILIKEWWPRMWHRTMCWFIGEHVPLRRVAFIHAPVAEIEDYQAIFLCPCEFKQPSCRLEFDAAWLQRSICRVPQDLVEYLGFSQIDLGLPGDESSLEHRIESALSKYFQQHHEFPPIERIASECFVSSQTLRRRLQREGTSYTNIKERIKRGFVTECLRGDKHPIAEVARLGGFADASGLTRAVKHWYGVSPRAYRSHYREALNRAGKNI